MAQVDYAISRSARSLLRLGDGEWGEMECCCCCPLLLSRRRHDVDDDVDGVAKGGLHDALWWHTFVFIRRFFGFFFVVFLVAFWVAAWMLRKGVGLELLFALFAGLWCITITCFQGGSARLPRRSVDLHARKACTHSRNVRELVPLEHSASVFFLCKQEQVSTF